MPTLALVNSVSFNQMKDTASEFPIIRTFGTVGWIISGIVISYIFSWDSIDAIASGKLNNTFKMVSLASIILGLFSFGLPKTPPFKDKQKNNKCGRTKSSNNAESFFTTQQSGAFGQWAGRTPGRPVEASLRCPWCPIIVPAIDLAARKAH